MDYILELINSAQPFKIYLSMFVLFYVTGLGIIPNSSDLNMIIFGSFIAEGSLNYTITALICATALSLSDCSTFLLSKVFGKKIINLKSVRKIFTVDLERKFEKLFNLSPFRPILLIRLAPTGRPPLIVILSAIGYPFKMFVPRYIPMVYLHVFCILGGSFLINIYFKEYFNNFKIVGLLAVLSIWIIVLISMKKRFSKITQKL